VYPRDRGANASGYLQNRLRTIQIGSALVRRTVLDRIRFPKMLRHEEDVLFWAAVLSENDVITVSRPVAIYNIDERRALLRQTSAARAHFLEFSKQIRALKTFGIEDRAIRWRRRWVAYRIARAFYLLGEPSAARPFARIASADALLLLRLAWRRLRHASVNTFTLGQSWYAVEDPSDFIEPRFRRFFERSGPGYTRTDCSESTGDQKLLDQSG
jgi:hypothetical protein